jgi:hypothetical protein
MATSWYVTYSPMIPINLPPNWSPPIETPFSLNVIGEGLTNTGLPLFPGKAEASI